MARKKTEIGSPLLDSLRRFDSVYFHDDPAEKLSGGVYVPKSKRHRGEIYDRYFAIIYVLEGKGLYRDYRGDEWRVEAGDLLIRHAGTAFRAQREDGWREFAAALPASLYRALRQAKIIDASMTLLRPGLSSRLFGLADMYIDSIEHADSGVGRCRSYALFMDFLLTAMRLSRHGEDAPWLARAKAMLSEHATRPLDLRDLAARLHMSYENFRRRFSAATGLSPKEYLIRRRLDLADALLMHSGLSIKEIAAKLGYSAISSFTRQYVNYRGSPPTEGRTKARV